uniref:Transcription factor gamyb n=1 Tax=Tanacetum cinerariifolium TaxID=118510 RepID=A0A6L2KGT4_TANCI|nr:transcription factor gamyb [Tanacetum cinerariifolium]
MAPEDGAPSVSRNRGHGGTCGRTNSGQVLKKGPWTAAEDAILMEYVRKNGEGNWNAVQRNSGLMRCGKSCRLRWANHLRPNLKKGAFTPDEERQIIELHSKFGNKWARMALHLQGRTESFDRLRGLLEDVLGESRALLSSQILSNESKSSESDKGKEKITHDYSLMEEPENVTLESVFEPNDNNKTPLDDTKIGQKSRSDVIDEMNVMDDDFSSWIDFPTGWYGGSEQDASTEKPIDASNGNIVRAENQTKMIMHERTWLAKLYLGSLSDVLREHNRTKSRLGGGHYGAPDVPSGYSIGCPSAVPMSSGSHAAGNTVIPKFDMHIFTSTMTVDEVNNIAEEYGIPLDLRPCVPSYTLRMINLPGFAAVLAILIIKASQSRQHDMSKPTPHLLNEKKLQTQKVQSNTVQALKLDSIVMENTCSGNENNNSESAFNKSVKQSSLDSETKNVRAIKYKMSKTKERCMTYFRSLHSHLQVLSKEDLKGTRIEHGFKRAFMLLFGQDVDTFTKSCGTESEVQDDNSKSENDTDADDADIRLIYHEEPMATEVNSRAMIQSYKTRNNNKLVDQKSHTQKPVRQIFKGHRFSPNKTSVVYEKTSPRSELSEPPHGSDVDILNIHECKQTLDVSEGTSINVQKEQSLYLSACTLCNINKENLRMIELESLFIPLFDEYFNGENQVVSKSSAVITADTSDKHQQQPDSTLHTLTLTTTVTADGNFDL